MSPHLHEYSTFGTFVTLGTCRHTGTSWLQPQCGQWPPSMPVTFPASKVQSTMPQSRSETKNFMIHPGDKRDAVAALKRRQTASNGLTVFLGMSF
jgi:hypothetical protein